MLTSARHAEERSTRRLLLIRRFSLSPPIIAVRMPSYQKTGIRLNLVRSVQPLVNL
jgi:hypothetical protein